MHPQPRSTPEAAPDGIGAALHAHPPLPAVPFLRRFVVRTRRRIDLIPLAAVTWIAAARGAATLHTAGGRHRLNRRLDELEATLDPAQFLRIHRSAIVNVRAVERLETDAHGDLEVVLRGGPHIPVSRQRQARIRAALLS